MSKELLTNEKSTIKRPKPEDKAPDKQHPTGSESVLNLQKQVGNQAVQRLIAQRQSDEGFELDDTTAERINRARGSGQPLDSTVQKQMGDSLGFDFSGVQVHTSPEADDLNRQLSAKAFTTGQDIFFKQGEYNPGSSSGKELIAHELTHVVQQGTGAVGSSGAGMKVTPPNDAFEHQADAAAQQAVNAGQETGPQHSGEPVQRQMPEEEEPLQMKADDTVQRQEEEELEDEEEVMMKADETVQRQEEEELEDEEEVMMKADDTVQRQGEEEEMMM